MDDTSRMLLEMLRREAEQKKRQQAQAALGHKVPLLFTALHGGLDDEQFDEAQLLIDRLDPSTTDHKGRTALHIAAKKPNTCRIIQYLISKGCKTMTPNKEGKTPLYTAIRRNIPSVCLAMIRATNPEEVRSYRFQERLSLAHLAAMAGDYISLRALIKECGVSVNEADPKGWTLLHIAAKSGLTAMIVMLIEGGAQVNCAKEDGFTPLHLACLNGHIAAADFLLQSGANLLAKNNDGKTPYEIAKEDKIKIMLRQWMFSGALKPENQHPTMPVTAAAVVQS